MRARRQRAASRAAAGCARLLRARVVLARTGKKPNDDGGRLAGGGTHAGRQVDWQRPGSNGAKILDAIIYGAKRAEAAAPSRRQRGGYERIDAAGLHASAWQAGSAWLLARTGSWTGQTKDRRAPRAGAATLVSSLPRRAALGYVHRAGTWSQAAGWPSVR